MWKGGDASVLAQRYKRGDARGKRGDARGKSCQLSVVARGDWADWIWLANGKSCQLSVVVLVDFRGWWVTRKREDLSIPTLLPQNNVCVDRLFCWLLSYKMRVSPQMHALNLQHIRAVSVMISHRAPKPQKGLWWHVFVQYAKIVVNLLGILHN